MMTSGEKVDEKQMVRKLAEGNGRGDLVPVLIAKVKVLRDMQGMLLGQGASERGQRHENRESVC